MVQFYLPKNGWDSEPGATLRLEGEEAHHAAGVFRMKPGDSIRIFDGAGSAAQGKIQTVSGSALEIAIDKKLPADPTPRVRIDIAQALLPAETMDAIVRQATELGAMRIWPLACDRSVARLDAAKRASKLEHWKKTVLAACKQCDRNTLPEVMPVTAPRDLAARFADYDAVAVACPVDPEGELDLIFARSPKRALLAIGPEGDFSPEEMKLFKQNGARVVSLGPAVLKSDTAAAAALATLQFLVRHSNLGSPERPVEKSPNGA